MIRYTTLGVVDLEYRKIIVHCGVFWINITLSTFMYIYMTTSCVSIVDIT